MEINGPLPGKAMPTDVSSRRQSVKTDSASTTSPPHFVGASKTGTTQSATSLSRLTADIQQFPEVREDVVSRVSERLSAGTYLTKEAAQSTAAAILKAQ